MRRLKRVLVLLTAFAASTLLLAACALGNNVIGNIDRRTTQPITASSMISFTCEGNEEIWYSVHTTTKQGTAEFAIFDMEGNQVVDWYTADYLKYPFTPEEGKQYEFRVNFVDFAGHFQAKIWNVASDKGGL